MLPESLARSCSIANYKQGKIVIFAANGATAQTETYAADII